MHHIHTNICSESKHVGEIERHNRTVKERVRGIFNTLPFKKMPRRMVAEMVYAAVFWLNAFYPNKNALSNLSPRAIVTGLSINFLKHCKHEFGTYVQTHKDTDNSMRARTVGAIALRPTGNNQGGHYSLSLTTGRRLDRPPSCNQTSNAR